MLICHRMTNLVYGILFNNSIPLQGLTDWLSFPH